MCVVVDQMYCVCILLLPMIWLKGRMSHCVSAQLSLLTTNCRRAAVNAAASAWALSCLPSQHHTSQHLNTPTTLLSQVPGCLLGARPPTNHTRISQVPGCLLDARWPSAMHIQLQAHHMHLAVWRPPQPCHVPDLAWHTAALVHLHTRQHSIMTKHWTRFAHTHAIELLSPP